MCVTHLHKLRGTGPGFEETEQEVARGSDRTEFKAMDEELLSAAYSGDVKKIRELVAKGADIEAKNSVRARSVEPGATNSETGQQLTTHCVCAGRIHTARKRSVLWQSGCYPCRG